MIFREQGEYLKSLHGSYLLVDEVGGKYPLNSFEAVSAVCKRTDFPHVFKDLWSQHLLNEVVTIDLLLGIHYAVEISLCVFIKLIQIVEFVVAHLSVGGAHKGNVTGIL